ncbi:MAG: hypothetical protein CMP82_15010 [Gammaproteobacteria bacterium]|nr:hypothetical protein [Gammaproteobacteria bacterium]|tara:strand:+ start:511 stop:1026 length:516 start_codon:yes stop_codon:yes gene_type:complete
MARRIDKPVPKHLRNAVELEQELALIEKEDMMLQHPTFLGNQRQFIDRIYQHLPEVADKLVKFMTANPERVYGSNGTVQLMLPEEVAMTDGQLQLFKLILQKGLPNQAPVTMSGEQNQFGSGKVAITINQTGPNVDLENITSSVDGVRRGQAEKVNTISFNRPDIVDHDDN